MTPILNDNRAVCRNLRTGIVLFGGQRRKGSEYVKSCQRVGRLLNPGGFGGNPIAQVLVKPQLKDDQPLPARENLILKIFELLSDVAFTVGKGLFADVFLRNQLLVGVGDLNVIAEHLIEADPQNF